MKSTNPEFDISDLIIEILIDIIDGIENDDIECWLHLYTSKMSPKPFQFLRKDCNCLQDIGQCGYMVMMMSNLTSHHVGDDD